MSSASKAACVPKFCYTVRRYTTHVAQIVPRIVGPVLTVTLFASGAAYIWHKGTDISLTNSVVPLLSVVVSASFFFSSIHHQLIERLGWLDSRVQVRRVIAVLTFIALTTRFFHRNGQVLSPLTHEGAYADCF